MVKKETQESWNKIQENYEESQINWGFIFILSILAFVVFLTALYAAAQ